MRACELALPILNGGVKLGHTLKLPCWMSTAESVLLDTSIIVAHFRREPALAERLKSATLYIPLTVLGELYTAPSSPSTKPKP